MLGIRLEKGNAFKFDRHCYEAKLEKRFLPLIMPSKPLNHSAEAEVINIYQRLRGSKIENSVLMHHARIDKKP